MKKKIGRTLGVFLVIGLMVAVPAFAVNAIARHPSDPSYAELKDDVWVRACDRDVHGHRVRAWYFTAMQDPDGPTETNWAPSGGCTEFRGTSWGQPAARMRICVEGEGCGPYWQR